MRTVFYGKSREEIAEKGVYAIAEVLKGNNAAEKESLLLCLDKYLLPVALKPQLFCGIFKGNIDRGELRGFKMDAKTDLSLTDEQINDRLRKGTLIEVL